MNQGRLVLVGLVLALAAPSASSQVAPDRLIVPGERIGQIELTGNLAAVRAAFGPETAQLPSAFGEGATLYAWASRALEVHADNTTGNLLLIFIGIPDTPLGPWGEFRTADGLGLGSTEQQVRAALRVPSGVSAEARGRKVMTFAPQGISFTLATAGPLAGQVVNLLVVWKARVPGDAVVVPGERLSAIRLGMSESQLLDAVGGGYILEKRGGETRYAWLHIGLLAYLSPDRVVRIEAPWRQSLEDAGIRYRTTEVHGMGLLGLARTEARSCLSQNEMGISRST